MILLPADSYVVINKTIITELDKKILIDLYQPIIGNKAVSFYFTLLNDLEKNSTISRNYNHHHLLSVMQLSLAEIKEARERLEAIGLIKTYLKKDKINNFVYLLYSPLSPNDFFNHPILSVVLYNNIGKTEYQKIINSYKIPRINLKDYDDISALFNDVFESVPANSFVLNKDIMMANNNKLKFNSFLDMETLLSGLSDLPISPNAFTEEIKDLIINLSCIYNLDVLTIQDLIKANIKETGMIDKDNLRKSCRNYYQFENNGNLPTLIYSKNKASFKELTKDVSKKEMMIYTFENTHPYQFLKSKYKDGKVIDRDLKLLETLLIDLKLNPGVVNVLIDYVLKVNNQKLNKNYVETIASQWKRLGIETVQEAMEACKKEHQKMLKIKTSLKDKKPKEQVVPEWFNQSIEKKEVSKEEEEQLKRLLESYE